MRICGSKRFVAWLALACLFSGKAKICIGFTAFIKCIADEGLGDFLAIFFSRHRLQVVPYKTVQRFASFSSHFTVLLIILLSANFCAIFNAYERNIYYMLRQWRRVFFAERGLGCFELMSASFFFADWTVFRLVRSASAADLVTAPLSGTVMASFDC